MFHLFVLVMLKLHETSTFFLKLTTDMMYIVVPNQPFLCSNDANTSCARP